VWFIYIDEAYALIIRIYMLTYIFMMDQFDQIHGLRARGRKILYLFAEEETLHMAPHRFSLSVSWPLLPRISGKIVCWEKVALVVCIKDAWKMDRFANIC
jgi:hypothetical protein